MGAPVRTAYVVSPTVAFVPHPREPGRWLRLHACVLFVKCTHCGAKPGQPCWNRGEVWSTTTHFVRRRDGRYKFPPNETEFEVRISPRRK